MMKEALKVNAGRPTLCRDRPEVDVGVSCYDVLRSLPPKKVNHVVND